MTSAGYHTVQVISVTPYPEIVSDPPRQRTRSYKTGPHHTANTTGNSRSSPVLLTNQLWVAGSSGPHHEFAKWLREPRETFDLLDPQLTMKGDSRAAR